jgi:hypothetical protein
VFRYKEIGGILCTKGVCYVVFNSLMFNTTKVLLCKWCFHIKFLLLPNACRGSVRALSFCYHNNNGSESTVVKTFELTWVEYHVAEPKKHHRNVFTVCNRRKRKSIVKSLLNHEGLEKFVYHANTPYSRPLAIYQMVIWKTLFVTMFLKYLLEILLFNRKSWVTGSLNRTNWRLLMDI